MGEPILGYLNSHEKLEVIIGGDPGIHYDCRAIVRIAAPMNLLEVFQRGLKRFGLSDIAGQNLAAAGKALLIQNQCQGNQGTVISTLFRAPEAPKSLIMVLARTMGVRQVMEDDCCRNIQQVALPAKQVLFSSTDNPQSCRVFCAPVPGTWSTPAIRVSSCYP